MIKLIIGEKGSGKTKALIESVNSTVETTNGSVVVIAKGKKLMHEIKYQARLIDTDEVDINNLYLGSFWNLSIFSDTSSSFISPVPINGLYFFNNS